MAQFGPENNVLRVVLHADSKFVLRFAVKCTPDHLSGSRSPYWALSKLGPVSYVLEVISHADSKFGLYFAIKCTQDQLRGLLASLTNEPLTAAVCCFFTGICLPQEETQQMERDKFNSEKCTPQHAQKEPRTPHQQLNHSPYVDRPS